MKPVTVLGVSALYHDAAAALLRDGEIVAAAQEERFSRKKRDPRFPQHAIDYCLEEAFIDPSELSAVVFYENLLLTFDRIVNCLLATAPAGREQWAKGAPLQLSVKMRFAEAARRALGSDVPVLYSAHTCRTPPAATSISTARAPTCCWSHRCAKSGSARWTGPPSTAATTICWHW